MADLQNLFDNCRVIYKRCFGNVKAMAEDVANHMRARGKDFDPRITAAKFDIVLQYSLLQIAVADYDFDRNELIFIRDLTEQGDFVNYINSLAKTNISWDSLYSSDVNAIRDLLVKLEGAMKELSKEFVAVFAMCDIAATDHDYAADLEKGIVLIIAGLMGMDGAVTEAEVKQNCAILAAVNEIKRIVNE